VQSCRVIWDQFTYFFSKKYRFQTYNGHKDPNIYLLGWVLGQNFSKQLRPKKVSPQTCQEINPIKTDKGHKAPNIYLIALGAGPEIFRTSWSQKSFSPNPS
jgi:hypothetical protein